MTDELLPPIKAPLIDGQYASRAFYRWMEGIQRFVQVPPEEGSTGTAANYDVGRVGGRIAVLDGGTAALPNTWGGYNLFSRYVTTQAHYRVQGVQVVGPQGASVADAVNAAAAPTQAEFNALVAQVNAILARLRAHGLIAT